MDRIEDEIRELAKQLKKNGVVQTEADAITLARNIIKTGRENHKIIEQVEKRENQIERSFEKVEEEKAEIKKELKEEERLTDKEIEKIREEEKNIERFNDPSYDITKENIPLKELIKMAEKKDKKDKENNKKEE